MKYWWRTVVKDYFTFTRRERIGFFVLSGALVVVYFLPGFFKPKKEPIPDDTFMQELASLKITIDSSNRSYSSRYEDRSPDFTPSKKYANYTAEKTALFYFDPNTLNAEGWKKLGLRDKTIQTIDNFRSKGYTFKQPEDIKRIYGLRPELAEKLIPFIRIAGTPKPSTTTPNSEIKPPALSSAPAPVVRTIRLIDVNKADTSAYISLPGIGGKLAARIVNFRDKLGGFISVEQIGETYGVPDSTFQKIKPMLQCLNPEIRSININETDVNGLKSHPYIKWNIANAIYNYRLQHGNYKTINDLKKIDIITEELFIKIAPYLTINQ